MKRFFLIPLMTLLTCVMAWGEITNVAQVGETVYKWDSEATEDDAENHVYTKATLALQAALEAAEDKQTVQLLNTVTLTKENGAILSLNAPSRTVTLDLNSMTINTTAFSHLIVVNAGKLIVDDKSVAKEGCINMTTNFNTYSPIRCYTEVEIKGGVIQAKAAAIKGENGSTITINGGALNYIGAANTSSTLTCTGSTLEMNGGRLEMTNAKAGISATNSTIEINGGTITAAAANAAANSSTICLTGSTLTLNAGEIISTSAKPALYAEGTDSEVTLNGGAVSGNIKLTSNAALQIEDGVTVTGQSGYVIDAAKDANGTPSITINGGLVKYVGASASDVILCNGATLTMNGGTIESTTKYCALYANNNAQLTINGGLLSNTSAIKNASVIDINGNRTAGENRESTTTTLNLNGGSIVAQYSGNDVYGINVYGKGATLNMVDGSIDARIAISGNGSTTPNDYSGTIINISGGTIGNETSELAIYHPQYGELNITGGDFVGTGSAIEMRSGELNISGNPTLTSLATESTCHPNGNGSTTTGAAISVAQHTTKLPIEVNINGGDFHAIYPIAQYNPQKNEQAYVDHVNITIEGGKFWATNTANVAAYTQDNKLKIKGGYYNLAPHAFVANGYVAINNPDEAPLPTVEDGYLFKVVQLEPETFESTLTEGNWVVEDTWKENESVADHIPTQHTNVTIPDGGNVYVQPTPEEEEVVAYAHNLTLAGDATLTVKDGATLVLGNEASVANTANLVVEAGGQLLIAPSESEVHPVGSVTLIADAAGLKQEGLDDSDPNNLYWQHFAIPTTEAPSIRVEDKNGQEITDPITYYNTWDIVNGWENVLKTNMNKPFQGYNLSNDRVYHSDIRYIFSGPLVGNASNPLVFARRGFSFFGNSYLAPINIRALQAAMYEQGMEYTVYVYVHRNASGPQIYRAINDVTAGIYGIDEIKPLEGFFMFAEKTSQADFQYNSAVYSAFLNKQMGGHMVNNAPARNAEPAYDAKVVVAVEAQNGESDEVILVASENFSNDYDLKADARKMENSGMNIYADGAFDDLAVMATNDLMGQTLSFKAGKDALYTMTFSNVEGELALYDNEVNQTISIAEGSTYTFAAQPNSTVNGRFEIVKPAMLPTAIENTEAKANIKGIYSITGMYLGENFNALPAGVYVVNGVKIVK